MSFVMFNKKSSERITNDAFSLLNSPPGRGDGYLIAGTMAAALYCCSRSCLNCWVYRR